MINKKCAKGAGVFLAGVIVGAGAMFFPYNQAKKEYHEAGDMAAQKAVGDWETGTTGFLELYASFKVGNQENLKEDFERNAEDLVQYGQILRDALECSDRISSECKNLLVKRISDNLENLANTKN